MKTGMNRVSPVLLADLDLHRRRSEHALLSYFADALLHKACSNVQRLTL